MRSRWTTVFALALLALAALFVLVRFTGLWTARYSAAPPDRRGEETRVARGAEEAASARDEPSATSLERQFPVDPTAQTSARAEEPGAVVDDPNVVRGAEPTSPTLETETPDETEQQAEPDGARIFGFVMNQENDAPFEGAEVSLQPRMGSLRSTQTTQSAADGSFEFIGLSPNMFTLWARAEGMISNDRRNKGPEVWIVAGQAESGPVLLRVYPGAELTVRVVSELDRAPIEGAEVSGFYPFVRRETDADGLASFDGLIPEDRRVTARAEGYLSRGAAAGLAAGEHAFIEIPLAPTGSIHGRISDVDGNPIEGARVYPSMPVGERIDQISLMTRSRPSDPEGFYRMSGLPLETPIDLQVSANGHSQKVVRYVRIPNEERLTRVDFELEKGESREPAAELLGSVEGVVVDMNGAPIAGASVTADARTAVATDASGRFRFDGVAHSPIHITSVTARAAGFAPQRVEYVPGPPESPPFVTIEMNPGHWIGGRVVDARGNPLADAIVEVEGAGGDRRTGLDGSFYIDSLPESVTFGFQRSWFSPQSVSKKSFQAASC